MDHLSLGGIGKYLNGKCRAAAAMTTFASTDQTYTPQTTPGLDYQSNFPA